MRTFDCCSTFLYDAGDVRKRGEASSLLESIAQYQRRMEEKEAIILQEEKMEEDIKVLCLEISH
jgi:hypothetical protein